MFLPSRAPGFIRRQRRSIGLVGRGATAMLLLVPLCLATVLTGTASAAPLITGTASPSTLVSPGTTNDSATFIPVENGAVFFRLYAPADTSCLNPVASEGRGIFANSSPQTYSTSVARNATIVGTYHWVARYQNNPQTIVYETACNDPAQQVVVTAPLSISGNASATVPMGGGAISDTATLAGGSNPTGLITFRLYAPSDPGCTLGPVFSATPTVNGTGSYPSGSYTPPQAGTYRWTASYSGDGSNPAAATACNAANQNVLVTPAATQITTQASPSVEVGGVVNDGAFLTAGVNPTGTVSFFLYGPNDPACSATPAFTSTVPVSGDGSAYAYGFTTDVAGTYSWVASYSGDTNNAVVTEPCGSPNESVVVTAPVSISGQASPTLALGAGQISDAATLTAGRTPTGTMTFDLYGPGDTGCVTSLFTSSTPTNGDGSYPSDAFTPTQVGTYRWVASYSGDGDDAAVATVCGAATQSVEVTPAVTQLTPSPPNDVTIGQFSTQDVDLSGPSGPVPTGTILFETFGPGDSTCANELGSISVTVDGYGNYSFTSGPDQVGTWRNRATYSGDASHAATATGCGDPDTHFEVAAATPQLPTAASASVTSGGTINDVATLSGSYHATGTITFALYGPGDTTCAGSAVFTSVKTVSFDNAYTSDAYTAFLPGTYRWTASYSGDADNAPVAGVCNAAGESVVVIAVPQITTQASATVPAGFTINDTARLSQGFSPTGTITFALYGPNDGTCAGPAIASSVLPVAGNATYYAADVTIALPGTYRWIASYSGDANNQPVTGLCNDPNESVDVATSIDITSTPDHIARPAPGGTFTFTVSVSNITAVPYRVTSLVDDVYGNLDGQGTCETPVMVADGDSYSCSFTGDFTGVAGDSQTDTTTVTAQAPDLGLPTLAPSPVGDATATASSTVSLTGAAAPGAPPAGGPAAPSPAVKPATDSRAGVLPFTGFAADRLGALGGALMIVGGLTLVATRRRRASR